MRNGHQIRSSAVLRSTALRHQSRRWKGPGFGRMQTINERPKRSAPFSLRLGARRVAPGGPLAAAALPVLSERIVHCDATAASSSPSKAKSCWRVEPRQDRSGQRSRGKLHPRCAGRFYIVVDLVDRSETEARNGRQDRLARHLPRIDFLVLHELDHLSFAQPGDPFHLVSRLYERNSIIENPLSANGPACSAGELLNRLVITAISVEAATTAGASKVRPRSNNSCSRRLYNLGSRRRREPS